MKAVFRPHGTLDCGPGSGRISQETSMSKYDALWAHIQNCGQLQLTLTFDEIGRIAGTPLDHSFLKYKKELLPYGYEVQKISMKAQSVRFARLSDLRASDACGDPEKHYRPGRRGHQRLRACARLPCRSQALKTHIRKMRQPNRKPAGLAFFVIRYLLARRRFLPPRPRAGYLRQS